MTLISSHTNGVFTLGETDTETDTDKIWLVHNCVQVFVLLRDRLMQISIRFCAHFISICISLGLGERFLVRK